MERLQGKPMRTYKNTGRWGASALVLGALVTPAHAQELDYDAETGAIVEAVPGVGAGGDVELGTIVLSAEQELRQQPGVSIITEEDLEQYPPANDLSEYIRRMPGVNLSGNTPTGQRGNNRQIDIRGMGPENTLILIDGKPVLSRNAVRIGRSGERDTRGDSNWVPPELVERIEVLRGPAAARYGSGASGGVVNIITKAPEEPLLSFNVHVEEPESSLEGGTRRANALLAQPLSDRLSYRFYISRSDTEGDDPDINLDATPEGENVAAGREGVENIDTNLRFTFRPDSANTWGAELGYSRQGNDYAGDTLFQDRLEELETDDGEVVDLIGEETNVIYRRNLALTHEGNYGFGEASSYIQWENTRNSRLGEGFAGSGQGRINSTDRVVIELDTVEAKTQVDVNSTLFGRPQTISFGADYRGEFIDDPNILENELAFDFADAIPDPSDRSAESDAHLVGLFVEDNILVTDRLTLTPGLRVDWHSEAGGDASPSLNGSYLATPEVEIAFGVSRAFKAPNLFQLNPNWLYQTRGNGCPIDYPSLGDGCTILGNPDLEPETSINKEIGVAYTGGGGLVAGLTYFHNDYDDRIAASLEPVAVRGEEQVFLWENTSNARIEGLEANLSVPFTERVTWNVNATKIESEDLDTGEPLSLVPEYTINTNLDWQVNAAWNLNLYATHYGETESPTRSITSGEEIDNPEPRDAYTLFGVTTNYAFNDRVSITGGVKNLFDKQLFREGTGNTAGANTYNEAGRAYFVGLQTSF